jgi:tetratricopeptide (TPR) repeat protein
VAVSNLMGGAPRRPSLTVLVPGGARWAAAAGLAALALGGWLISPASPLALGRGDAALGHGDSAGAAVIYDAVARWNPWRQVRQQALRRGAAVWAIELGDRAEARRRMEALVRTGLDGPAEAAAYEQIGEWLREEGQIDEAARLFTEAYESDPRDEEAPDRLARAAQLLGEVGEHDAAIALWDRLSGEFPAWRARAALGEADTALAAGATDQALAAYREAAHTSLDPQVAAVAQLGVSTCLERMGSLDDAQLAADAADLPEEVHRERTNRLEERR